MTSANVIEYRIEKNGEVVGNFRIEPPGIFLGRGCHPKAGKIKRRIYPEDITLNIDNKAFAKISKKVTEQQLSNGVVV